MRSVDVDDLDFVRMVVLPNEANPPLVVDADRVLADAIAFQCFEPIAGRHEQITNAFGVVEQTQLPQRFRLNIGGQSAAASTRPDRRSLRIVKADDHNSL
jgi:hypothetical protein